MSFRRCKGTAKIASPQSHSYVILYTKRLVYRQKSPQIVVCHRTYAGVGPYIFGCFHHIYNSINR